MRKTLPLLQAPKPAAIEQVSCAAPNPDCRKCALHRQPFFNRCVPGAVEGDLESGERLLTIGIAPGREEDRQNRPNVGESGSFLRFQLKAQWKGAIAHTNAVNCYPGTDEKTGALAEIKTDYIDACRSYVRNVIREFQPTRILAFGTQAIHSLFNRSPGIMAVRRGFSWLLNHHDNRHDCPTWYVNVDGDEQVPWGCRCEPIPVLFLMHPAAACRNRFVKKDWMEDLKWALTTPDSFFRDRYIFLREGKVEPIETVERTAAVLAELEATCRKSGKPIVLDVETRGKQFNKDFRIISLALCIAGDNRAYVWTAKALQNPDIVRLLVASFDDEDNIWVEQSDYDEVSIVAAWGHKLAGERRDTRLIRRLMEPGIKSDLGTMSERVGMGGYKVDFDDLVDQAIKRCIPKKATRSVKSKSSGGWEPLQTTMFDDCPDHEARLAIWEGYKSGDKFFEPRTFAYAIVPTQQTTIYNGQDVVSTGLYHEMAWPELRKRKNLAMVWDELSCPSGRSYAQMRVWGIPADKQAITSLIHWAQTQQATAERACRRHLLDTQWADMNIGSDKQIAKLLFSPHEDGGLGLFPIKRTKGNAPSTDKESMAALADKHPFVADYSRYAYWDGFVNKGKEFLRSIRADGRMHPSYLPDGTECMPAGELVLTNRGYIPVEQVRVGDSVITHKGRVRRVTACQTFAASPIYRTTLANGLSLRTTANHSFLMANGFWKRADGLIPETELVVHGQAAEQWKAVPGWYVEVSSWGRVRNTKTNRILALQPKERAERHYGHLKVSLARNGARKRGPDYKDFAVHRLVMDAFGPSGDGETRHLNGIAWDNSIVNLAWGSSKENKQDAIAHGTMSHRLRSSQTKLTQEAVDDILATPRSVMNDREMGERYGVSRELVRDVRLGKRWLPEPVVEKAATFGVSRVVSVEVLLDEVTYGLTVEEDESHVTGGIVTHNTGRSSATDPNVFNIRRADDCPACKGKEPAMLSCETCDGSGIDPDTKKQRDMIRAEDGYVLVEVDLSQVELRGMAVMSGDEVMSTAFAGGLDIHQYAAEVATRISGMNITRQDAKWVNFGIGYGMTEDTLAKKLKCTKEKAKRVMDAIYGAYKGVVAHKGWMVNYARQHGHTFTVWFQQNEDGSWQTVMAGQRPLYDIASEDGGRRHHAENAAYNTLIQGTFSGFLVLDAHARVCRYIEEEQLADQAQVILSVYDSIILHVKEGLVEYMADVTRRIMTRCCIGYTKDGKPFPLKADVKVGKSYGSMKKMEHWKKERAARCS